MKQFDMKIPKLSLVVLVGVSGSGKSSFARKHFKSTEIISSDHCRALVSDDENDLSATSNAFELVHFIAEKRLASGKLTVIDATNVQVEARKPLIAIARRFHALPVAIILDLPEKIFCTPNSWHLRPPRTSSKAKNRPGNSAESKSKPSRFWTRRNPWDCLNAPCHERSNAPPGSLQLELALC